MNNDLNMQPTRKSWRKLVKKLQRKRRRQKMAKDRDKQIEINTLAKLNDPVYQEWQKQQNELEEFQKSEEQRQHDEEEENWLRRELIARRQFRLEQERRKAEEAAKEALRLKQEKELEEREIAWRKRREERERLAAEAATEFEMMMAKMDMYLIDFDMKTPKDLKRYVETKPGQKLCEFYERTNCCRFGNGCSFNHRRPMLARIIMIQHFFTHPLLEPVEKGDCAVVDAHSESSERDLRNDYDEFFQDVVQELESFGKIQNFCALRNVLLHLRGNVFVEYEDKRSALKAFIKLHNRFYAMKRLTVEFSNIKTWRGAVCGLSLSRKCLRGNKCSYLHLFKNPKDKYNCVPETTKSSERYKRSTTMLAKANIETPLLSWNDICNDDLKDQSRNWRWSESPEKQIIKKLNSSPQKHTNALGDYRSNDDISSQNLSSKREETRKNIKYKNSRTRSKTEAIYDDNNLRERKRRSKIRKRKISRSDKTKHKKHKKEKKHKKFN